MIGKRLKELQDRAISLSSVGVEGSYTSPCIWDVYKVEALTKCRSRKGIHFGNHPVRQRELERQCGESDLVLLFRSRTGAEPLKLLLINDLSDA